MKGKKNPIVRISLSGYKYKPEEIEAAARTEYERRLAKGEATSMAECRKIVQNLKDRTGEGEAFKEELDNLVKNGMDSFNLKRFSLEEKEYADKRFKKYQIDLREKGIDTTSAPNDFAVRQIIELEIQIQREWSFLGCLPIKDKEKVHNDSIKTLGEELRRMLDGLNALEKSAGKPMESGASLSDLAEEMDRSKRDIKQQQPKVGEEVKNLRKSKNLDRRYG
jgi:hypothetical protein